MSQNFSGLDQRLSQKITIFSSRNKIGSMETILELCKWCSDVFGLTLSILLFLIFLPAIVAVAMLVFILAVPIGMIYGIVKYIKES